MPFNATSYRLNPGGTLTGATVDAALDAVAAVLGPSAANRGWQDSDVPDDAAIPNTAVELQRQYVTLTCRPTYSPTLLATMRDRWPPSSIIVPFAAELVMYDYDQYAATVNLMLARNGRVFAVRALGVGGGELERFPLGTPELFAPGDVWTVVATTAPLLALGATLRAEVTEQIVIVDGHFRLTE